MKRLVQMVPAFHREDAIGQHIRTLHRYFQSAGWETHILALDADPDLQSQVTPLRPDVLEKLQPAYWMYHYALPSPLTDLFQQAQGKRVLVYHNLTPPEYFRDWNPGLARLLERGREELQHLARSTDWALADSLFNAYELRNWGYREVDVIPILVDWSEYPPPSDVAREQYIDPFYQHWLFVGRVVPNKKIEDLLAVLFWYRKYYRLSTRLMVVGKPDNAPRYAQWLMDVRRGFHLEPQDASFLGVLPYEDLVALYQTADLVITLSDHEGFCLPVLEALHYQKPVLAYAAGALPETVGPAGVLVATRDPVVIAEFVAETLARSRAGDPWRKARKKHLATYEALPHLIRMREALEVL